MKNTTKLGSHGVGRGIQCMSRALAKVRARRRFGLLRRWKRNSPCATILLLILVTVLQTAAQQPSTSAAADAIENFKALSSKQKIEAMNLVVANLHKRLNEFFSKDTVVEIARHKDKVEQDFRVEDLTDADPEVDAPSLVGAYLASVLMTLYESNDTSLTPGGRAIGKAVFESVPNYSQPANQSSPAQRTAGETSLAGLPAEITDVAAAIRGYYVLMYLGMLDADPAVRSLAQAQKDQGPRVLRGTDYFFSFYGGKAFRRQGELKVPVTVMVVRRTGQTFLSVERFYKLNLDPAGLPDRVPDSAETGVKPSHYRRLSFVDGDAEIQLYEQPRDQSIVSDGEQIAWSSPKVDESRADAMITKLVEAAGSVTGPNRTILVDSRAAVEPGSRSAQVQERMVQARTLAAHQNTLAAAPSERVEAQAQQPPDAVAKPNSKDLPQLAPQEETLSFRVKVSLVEVRVVVRDSKGNTVGSLKQEDFVLFDDKKPQTISHFAVEKHAPAAASPEHLAKVGDQGPEDNSKLTSKWQVAYLIDDFHTTPADMLRVRKALEQSVAALAADQLLAIFTLSGQTTQDFTSDKERLQAALRSLKPAPHSVTFHTSCPPVNYYIADQATLNGAVFEMIVDQVWSCQFQRDRETQLPELQAVARAAIARELTDGDFRTRIALLGLKDAIARLSAQPGSRSMVLISSGFYSQRHQAEFNAILDRAVRLGVIVSTLDVRGVHAVDPAPIDASAADLGGIRYLTEMSSFRFAADSAESDPLIQIANTTGGTFIHNNNDLAKGLEKVSTPPEYSYLLAFAPQNLQNDGKFHSLKVVLKEGKGLSVQARKGYDAPKEGTSSSQHR